MGVWRVAITEWGNDPEGTTLPEVVTAAAEAVHTL